MKLIALFLVLGLLQVAGKTSAQVSLKENAASLEKVLLNIKDKSGFDLFFDRAILKAKARPVTITVSNVSVEEALRQVFKDQPELTYTLEGRIISVKEKLIASPNSTLEVTPPPIEIHGKVTDENGKPVVGASVRVKGTDRGTTTNENGEFTLADIDVNAILVFSSINTENFEVKVNSRTELTINLRTKITELQDVIVNKGYYSTTQKLNTGNVSRINSDVIIKQPVSNVLAALEGRMPGVNITQLTGVPGGGFKVQIRGQNSLRNSLTDNGNLPLYIVDGVPYTSTSLNSVTLGSVIQYGSPLSAINTSDIEGIEVLKDADATSIYGARGSNGVILITTKKGKAGKTKIDFNLYSGSGKITNRINLLNTQQYLQVRHEAFNNDGTAPTSGTARDFFLWDTTRYTDWQNTLIGGVAHTTNASIAMSGGNATTQFVISGVYNKESTVFPGDFKDQKGSFHFNLNHQSEDKKLKVSLSTTYLVDNNNILPLDLTRQALILAPNAPAIYDANNILNWQNSSWTNPLSYIFKKYKISTDNLIINSTLSYQLFPGLELNANLGYNYIGMKELSTNPIASFDPAILSFVTASATSANNYIKTWILEPQAHYLKKIGGGMLNVLMGTTFQQNQQEGETIQAGGYTNDALLENIKAATTITVLNAGYSQYKYNAIFARINYNWQEKYLVNLTGRRDGSSRFGSDRQFANFGSIGMAWIFSGENFAKRLPFLSLGKLRASYGTSGSDQIGDYGYLDSYSPTTYQYNGSIGLIPNRLSNRDYSWENNKKLEVGLETGFLENRILFTASWYRNRSSNQLVGYALPVITGQSSIQYNLPATVQNTGLEFELNTVNIKNRYFTWTLGINITLPKNKLISYPNIEGSSYANTYMIGKSLTIQKLYQYNGIDPTTGLYTFEDIDRDGKISFPNDIVANKEIAQKFYGGLLNSLKYKGFQIDFFLQFVKQTARNYFYSGSLPGSMFNLPAEILDRWQKPGDYSSIQRYTRNFGSAAASAYNNMIQSDRVIGDASFIRLKNLSIAYQLPFNLCQKLKLQNAQVYIRGQNLFTVSNYFGLDPENTSTESLPPLKMLTAGIQITL